MVFFDSVTFVFGVTGVEGVFFEPISKERPYLPSENSSTDSSIFAR